MKRLPRGADLDDADVSLLWEVVGEWYNENMSQNEKPGSELWVTTHVLWLVADIRKKWAAKTGLDTLSFPWRDEYVALLVTKRRKHSKPPKDQTLNHELF